MMRPKDKVVLITGFGSGIRETTAKTFAREGATVVVPVVDDEADNRIVSEIRPAGGKPNIPMPTLENLPISKRGSHLPSVNSARLMYSTITPCLHWLIDLGPILQQSKGAITNTASVSGLDGDYTLGLHNAAKAGLVHIPRVTGIESARKGIRCIAVCTGPILTPALKQLGQSKPKVFERTKEAIPMGRYGEP